MYLRFHPTQRLLRPNSMFGPLATPLSQNQSTEQSASQQPQPVSNCMRFGQPLHRVSPTLGYTQSPCGPFYETTPLISQ
jgi:hypothetical protein